MNISVYQLNLPDVVEQLLLCAGSIQGEVVQPIQHGLNMSIK